MGLVEIASFLLLEAGFLSKLHHHKAGFLSLRLWRYFL